MTVRDGNPEAWLAGGRSHRTLPTLTPFSSLTLEPGASQEVPLVVGEDLKAARAAGLEPSVNAHVRLRGLAGLERFSLALNGKPLTTPTVTEDWLDFAVPPEALIVGSNRATMVLAPAPARPDAAVAETWPARFEGGALPGKEWTKDPPASNCLVEVRDGALLIADRGTANGDYCYFRNPAGIARGGETVIEARVKVVSGVSSLIFGNGDTGQRLRLYPDRVEFYHDPTASVQMDTTDNFHTYRLSLRGENAALTIDGQPRLDGKGCFRPGRSGYRNGVAFGAANSPEVGEALWSYVRARSDGATLLDLVLSVRYPARP